MTKVVVTGGSGFLGSYLADQLTADGFDVTIFDRRPSPYLQPGQRMIEGDLLDANSIAAALEGADYVYHLAGFADLNAARTRPAATVQLNVLGTVNLLEAAVKAGVKRVLFASTVYVYSRAGGFYRCSKQSCEAYIEEFHQQYGLEYTILRFGSLYGPRADETNGVYRLLKQARAGQIAHVGQPDDSREYIHVEDAARLSIQALDDAYANQHIVLTGHHPIRLHDLFTMFSEILGHDVAVDYQQPPADHKDGHYSVTPYSFNPRVGRKLTANYYVDMGQGILQILEQMEERR
jgi:UDP-glucose 4-epimerase